VRIVGVREATEDLTVRHRMVSTRLVSDLTGHGVHRRGDDAGNPLKILHVIPSIDARDGGPSVAVRAMARVLSGLGVDVTVATTVECAAPAAALPTEASLHDGGVEYRCFGRSLPGNWKFSWPLTKWLFSNTTRFDVLHVHALFSYATIPACRAARRTRVPYVLGPLGTLDPWSLRYRGWKKRPYLRLIERPHLGSAAAIHVTSRMEADGVAALGYAHLTHVIPLGVDAPAQRHRPAERSSDSLRLLFLSRLHQKKGLPLLLNAMHRVRSSERQAVRLIIAGEGPKRYRLELEALCRELGLEKHVAFVGHVEGAAKARLLAACDIFVLPSSQENFGLAAAEALAAGLPLIVSEHVGIAPDIRDAGAGVIVPLDAERLARVISDLAARPEARWAMGDRGARLAAERFSWERTGRGLLDLYHAVINRPAVAEAQRR
jgi:glycosyltransferase involved in cell wall biosynthesis